ncbi:hypothetical protein ACFYZT_27980 [Streptomyces sp. NPDC001591]|uniref:hypothetical protein n=1 Tax=Streptomyces sp. NPDC001591 TaxID=3364589 RepID=UPI0036941A61
MTEPQTEPQAVTGPAPETPAPAAPASNRRKRIALLAAAAAVALLAGGSVWALSATADRTAPTAYWVEAGGKLPEAEHPAPVPANDLTGKLLPAPSGFKPGPDLEEEGNDFYVSGEKAVEGFKEARKGLSTSERKKRDDALADLKLKGLAGRSYASTSMVVEVRLMQADPKALGAFSEVSRKMSELMGAEGDAPKVDGYPDARCGLLSLGEDRKEKETIDSLSCVAVQGDVMVSFRAYGARTAGLSKIEATAFLKNQLSRLKSPGESV